MLFIVTFFTPETPSPDTPAEAFAAAVVADADGHVFSLFLHFVSDVLFLVFLAGVWSRFRRWEGSGGLFSGLFALAAAVFYSTILVSEGLYLALVKAAQTAEPSALLPLALLDDWVGTAGIPALVAMFVGATGVILSTRALPVWLGWLGAVTAVLLLVALAGVFTDDVDAGVPGSAGAIGFLLYLVWVLAASIVLVLRGGGESHQSGVRDADRTGPLGSTCSATLTKCCASACGSSARTRAGTWRA